MGIFVGLRFVPQIHKFTSAPPHPFVEYDEARKSREQTKDLALLLYSM
jgi:hypothetical protein